jgi:hypothetical protein
MEAQALRALIREKIQKGRLPLDSIPRFWGGPSNGEVCDACETLITDQLVMEGIADGSKRAIQMHVDCFAVWDEARREPLN